jgi:hypothetical protein
MALRPPQGMNNTRWRRQYESNRRERILFKDPNHPLHCVATLIRKHVHRELSALTNDRFDGIKNVGVDDQARRIQRRL